MGYFLSVLVARFGLIRLDLSGNNSWPKFLNNYNTSSFCIWDM